MNSVMPRKRVEYFEILRIFASSVVILAHVQAPIWPDLEIFSFSWHLCNFYRTIACWAAAIFFMISGALFLNPDYNPKNLFKKNTVRMATALFFWSFIYVISSYIIKGYTLAECIRAFFLGHYHLWFLYVLIGLYLATPILRKVVESTQLLWYLLNISLLFFFLIPQIADIVGIVSDFGQELIGEIQAQFYLSTGSIYVVYYILGYYLHTTEISAKQRKWIYVLGILSLIGTMVLTAAASLYKNQLWMFFFEHDSINIVLISMALFVFAKYHFSFQKFSQRAVSIFRHLSKYSFGIYLCHPLVLDILQYVFGFSALSFTPFLSIPLIFILTTAISYALSAVLYRIPMISKYIV